jgi:hypothetical protein
MQHSFARGLVATASVAAFLATLVPPADATTVIRRSTEELTVLSEFVVEGTVTDVEARWRDDHKFVYTYVTIEVEEVMKGRLGESTIVLEELGGTANGVTATVEGVPVFEAGERVIVFLDVVEDAYRCHGFAQGKFTVQDARGGRVVSRPTDVELTFGRDHDGRLDSTIDPDSGTRPYQRFVRTIEAWKDRLDVPGGER